MTTILSIPMHDMVLGESYFDESGRRFIFSSIKQIDDMVEFFYRGWKERLEGRHRIEFVFTYSSDIVIDVPFDHAYIVYKKIEFKFGR